MGEGSPCNVIFIFIYKYVADTNTGNKIGCIGGRIFYYGRVSGALV